MNADKCQSWSALWRHKNKIDGTCAHIIYHNGLPALFKTRRDARAFINSEYGYIRHRADLKAEPHGWKIPIAIRVSIAPTKGAR